MASRDCAIMGVLLLMFLCVGSAHRLFLETTEGSTASSSALVKHNQAIHESTTGLFENRQATQLLEKLAQESLSRILPLGEEPSYKPLLVELAHEPLGRALPLGEEPSNEPAEKEEPGYGQTAPVNTNAIQEDDFFGDLTNIETFEPAPPDSAPVVEEDDFSGDFTNIDPEFN